MTNPQDLTPEQCSELLDFARVRIGEDFMRAQHLFINKTASLDAAAGALGQRHDFNPAILAIGLVMSRDYKDHPDYKPEWDQLP